jgi:hypothetical protein
MPPAVDVTLRAFIQRTKIDTEFLSVRTSRTSKIERRENVWQLGLASCQILLLALCGETNAL